MIDVSSVGSVKPVSGYKLYGEPTATESPASSSSGSNVLSAVLNKMLDLGGEYATAAIADKYQTYQKDGNTPGVYPSGQPAAVAASTPGYSLPAGVKIMPLIIGGVVLLVGALLVYKLLRK